MSPALAHLADRVRTDPLFFASALDRYRVRQALTDADLAAELGCDPETLSEVKLCGVPRVEPAERFAADCRAIADRFGLEVEVVERVAWPW